MWVDALLSYEAVVTDPYNIGNYTYTWYHENEIQTDFIENTFSIENTLDNLFNDHLITVLVYDGSYYAIDTVTDSDENKTDTANELYEQLLEISHELEKLIFSDSVYQLAVFETNKYIDNLLQTKYAMEAYEDNLEDCIDKALDDALGKLSILAHAAHEELDHIFELIDNFKNTYSELIGFFKGYHKKINQEIDNT